MFSSADYSQYTVYLCIIIDNIKVSNCNDHISTSGRCLQHLDLIYICSCLNKESTNLKKSIAGQIIIEKKVPISHLFLYIRMSPSSVLLNYDLLIIPIP